MIVKMMGWMRYGIIVLVATAFGMLAMISGAYAARAPDSFADLAEKLLPAVVNISTSQAISAASVPEIPQFPPGSPFEDYFERQKPEAAKRTTSLGSGFIIDPSGLVVTNNHVIADADEITVILYDNTALKAEVVGRDTKTDLALLKITTSRKLSSVSFGNSDEARIGDWVITIGNPFGLGGTVTVGILSARARDINAGPYDDFLQTDASINRGNSGGPMFNMRGDVIGINTAIFSPSGGSIGIGFAIPSTLAKQVIADLQQYGRTKRGWLGVRIQSLNEDIAESLGLKGTSGALVSSVTENGPAALAGIRAGDVVLQFNGRFVTEMRRLPRLVAETPIGKPIDVVVWRDNKKLTLKVAVAELEESDGDEFTETGQEERPKQPVVGQLAIPGLGLSVSTLTPSVRSYFNLSFEKTKGVVVVEVEKKGIAEEKGLRPGDIILEVSQEEVKSPTDLAEKVSAARAAGRKTMLLLVESESGLRFVALRIDQLESKQK